MGAPPKLVTAKTSLIFSLMDCSPSFVPSFVSAFYTRFRRPPIDAVIFANVLNDRRENLLLGQRPLKRKCSNVTIAAFNEKVHPSEHRLGGWRSLYLSFIHELKPDSIIEFGCGGNTFLSRLPESSRRAGIDGGNRFEDAVKRIGAEFYSLDLDHDVLPDIGPFDVVVCSDVLEHLLYPERTVEYAARLASTGVFFSHVPNEYHWKRTLKVMMGRETSVYFHHGCEEWENPHLRRFTDSGFRKLLGRHFAFNLDISDLRASRLPRFLSRIGLKPPYCLKGGPTYASTNDEAVYKKLVQAKKALRSSAGAHS